MRLRVFENGLPAKGYSIYSGNRITPRSKLIECCGKGEETFLLEDNSIISSDNCGGYDLSTNIMTVCKDGTEPYVFQISDVITNNDIVSKLFMRKRDALLVELVSTKTFSFDASQLVDINDADIVLTDCAFLLWKLDNNFFQHYNYSNSQQCTFDICPNDRYGFLFVFRDKTENLNSLGVRTGIFRTNDKNIEIEKNIDVEAKHYFSNADFVFGNSRSDKDISVPDQFRSVDLDCISNCNKLYDLKIFKLNRGNGGCYIPCPCDLIELHKENMFAYNHNVKTKINYFLMRWPKVTYVFILDLHGKIRGSTFFPTFIPKEKTVNKAGQ